MAAVVKFSLPYPPPVEVNIKIPSHLDKQLFQNGFDHGLQSNELTCFKASYRAGFREAKLYLRQAQQSQGILELPKRSRCRVGFLFSDSLLPNHEKQV